jgi:altronate dehydratase
MENEAQNEDTSTKTLTDESDFDQRTDKNQKCENNPTTENPQGSLTEIDRVSNENTCGFVKSF